jgi:hypothetical protein
MDNRQRPGVPTRPGIANLPIGVFTQVLSTIPRSSARFLVAAIFSVAVAGCASPGEPYERKPPTPAAVTDLTAAQSGNDVVLTFTMPQEAVDHRPLSETPSVEIFRDFAGAPAQGQEPPPPASHPALLVTIPGAMVSSYIEQGHFRYTDSLRAEDFAQHPDALVSYTVQTSVSEKKRSDFSKPVPLRIYPAALPIADLKTEVTHPAIVLSWTPPEKTLAGAVPSISVYHIYRGMPDTSAPAGGAPKLKSPLVKIADAETPPFQDTQFEFGATYVYSVRSVAQYPGGANIESADSNLAEVSPRDTFPPAAPQGLVVVLVPRQGDTPARLELSWSISPETDIAGYNVYRSEQEGVRGSLVSETAAQKVLPTPAFSDMNVQPGHRYFYSATAVDRAGNESAPSAAVSGEVPAETQTTP